MCQPGRPGPQGDGQLGSPCLAAFHRAKSSGSRLLPVMPVADRLLRRAQRVETSCPDSAP